MMMNREEMMNAVRVYVEEWTPFESVTESGIDLLGGDNEVRPVASYIDALLDTSAADVVRLLPNGALRLDGGLIATMTDSGQITVRDDGVGVYKKPVDWVRLYWVKYANWSRGVSECISATGNPIAYSRQQNRWLRGRNERPVVADMGGNLELYSVGEAGDLEALRYVKTAKAEEVQEDIQPAVVLMTALNFCRVYERTGSVNLLGAALTDVLRGLGAES